MNDIHQFAILFYFIQLIHSTEELVTGFHKKWYLFKMPFWVFLLFEISFNTFWGLVIFTNVFPYKAELHTIFCILMICNAIQHVVWSAGFKRYVPGLYTTPLHLIAGLLFAYKLLAR